MPVNGVQGQKLVQDHTPELDFPVREWIHDHENKFTDILHQVESGAMPALSRDLPDPRAQDMLRDDNLHPWALFVLLSMRFDQEWLDWEPETIHKTIQRQFDVVPNETRKNQIGAIKAVMNDHRFWRDYRVFGWTCVAWNGQIPRFDIIPRPYAAFMLDTVGSISWIRTDVFKPEVKIYIKKTLEEYGVAAPLSLSMVDRPQSDLAKEYLFVSNEESMNDILEEAENKKLHYDLKTIGAIDYYLARLQTLNDQLTRLLGGLSLDGSNGSA